jgi:macrolide-specific efflux system membrane fusion protein
MSEISGLEVSAAFSESDSAGLKVGQSAAFTFSALTGTTVAGKVTKIASTSTVTNNVVTYAVTIALDNAPSTVKAGMTASAVVTTAQANDALRVPTAAVRGRGTTGTVTVIKNGKQTPQAVGVGLRGDSFAEITSGLTAGEKIVVSTSSGSFTGGPTGGATGGGTGGGGLGGGLGGGGFGPPGG